MKKGAKKATKRLQREKTPTTTQNHQKTAPTYLHPIQSIKLLQKMGHPVSYT